MDNGIHPVELAQSHFETFRMQKLTVQLKSIMIYKQILTRYMQRP